MDYYGEICSSSTTYCALYCAYSQGNSLLMVLMINTHLIQSEKY